MVTTLLHAFKTQWLECVPPTAGLRNRILPSQCNYVLHMFLAINCGLFPLYCPNRLVVLMERSNSPSNASFPAIIGAITGESGGQQQSSLFVG
jgi:hypothetical protein